MFSKIGVIRPLSTRFELSRVIQKSLQGSIGNGRLSPVAARCLCTTKAPVPKETEQEATGKGWTWVEANKIFYGPQRDFVNFPIPKMKMNTPEIRQGFIPETFFQGFYDKTGVSGGYVFIATLSTYLASKEIFIHDSDLQYLIPCLPIYWFLYFKVFKHYGVGDFMKKRTERANDGLFAPLDGIAKSCQVQLDRIEEERKSFETDVYFYQAAQDYFDLVREFKYRETLQDYSKAVKDRLDYHFEMENVKVKFEQEIMVDWIKTGVLKSITPQLEKDTLKTCISTLKELSTKQVA